MYIYIYAPINNVFYSERLEICMASNRKSHYDLWIFVVRFCYIRHERIFFSTRPKKKEGSSSFMKTSSLNPTHLLNFILSEKRVNVIKILLECYLWSDE